MLKRLLITLLLAVPAWAAPVLVHNANGTALPLTVTSTSAGDVVIVGISSTVVPGSIKLGAGTMTQQSCLTDSTSTLCVYEITGIAAATSVTCGSACGTVHEVYEYEYSGVITTNPLDHASICIASSTTGNNAGDCNSAGTPQLLSYHPGFSAEAVVAIFNCQGSATSLTGSTWLNTSFPSGDAGGQLISSGFTVITAAPDSGCSFPSAGIVIGFQGVGSTQQCASDLTYYDYSTQLGSSGNPTITATVNQLGDLIIAAPWCITSCTVTSVTMGTDTLTATSVAGNSDATTGQGRLYYKLSSGVSGAQTLTFTPTGTRTGSQVAYYDFTPSAGCTWSHDVDSSVGSGTGTTTATTPSITPTTGDLLFNFTYPSLHVLTVNSPWLCQFFNISGESGSCFNASTVNAQAYVLSAAGGATANNMSIISGNYQALLSSFTLTGSGVIKPVGQFPRVQ